MKTLFTGDSLAVLRTLSSKIAQTCVTSPPYFGLRDYGISGQIGLEETPEAYIQKLVEVFREVRRVLRDDGTLWLNLGDGYVSAVKKSTSRPSITIKQAQGGHFKRISSGLKSKDLMGIPWRVAFA